MQFIVENIDTLGGISSILALFFAAIGLMAKFIKRIINSNKELRREIEEAELLVKEAFSSATTQLSRLDTSTYFSEVLNHSRHRESTLYLYAVLAVAWFSLLLLVAFYFQYALGNNPPQGLRLLNSGGAILGVVFSLYMFQAAEKLGKFNAAMSKGFANSMKRYLRTEKT